MSTRCRRLAASLSIAVLVAACLPPHAEAAGPASFGGRVVGSDGITPFAGAIVHLVTENGNAVVHSHPTDGEGAFAIDPAPSGSYRLLVETDRGSFLAPDPVSLEPGANPAMSLTLMSAGPSFQLEPGIRAGKIPKWGKYVIIGALGVAGLFAIDEISQDHDEPATPF